MADPIVAPKGSVTPQRIIIHAQEASRYRAMVELAHRSEVEKKYNIKLLRHDYDVIKAAADLEDRSASYFVSFLIYDMIARTLSELGADCEDARLLLGQAADAASQHDILSTPWLHDLMRGYCDGMIAQVTKNGTGGGAIVEDLFTRYEGRNSHAFGVVKLMLES